MNGSGPGHREFVFVLEQALGHAVHAANMERALHDEADITPSIIRISPPPEPTGRRLLPIRLPANWSLQASWATRSALARLLPESNPDAMFIHTQVSALLAVPMMRRVPTIVSLDATPVNFDSMARAYRHPTHPRQIEALKKQVTRRALHAARAVVTWSRWAGDSVVRDYGVPASRVHVIHPGVDVSHFRPRVGPRDPGPVRVLFVGGDFERKGGLDLLDAVAAAGPLVELDIVTSSSAAPPSAGQVRVHTGVTGNSLLMTQLYSRADLFALPAYGECLSIAIEEALASGLPVISTSVGGVPELVRDGYNGFVVRPGDRLALGAALTRLIDNRDLRVQMGTRSREMAIAHHDVFANCRRILALMTEIADARPSGPSGASTAKAPGC